MAKKKLTTLEKIKRAFQADLEDTELQERFERFKRELKVLKDRYNENVPVINKKLENKQTLEEMILKSALMGFINEDAIKKYSEVNSYLESNIPVVEELQKEIDYHESHIKRLYKNSEDKLFRWWSILREVEETEPWLEWEKQYEDKII